MAPRQQIERGKKQNDIENVTCNIEGLKTNILFLQSLNLFIRQNFVDADMRIAIILSFPSSNILILFVDAVEQRIETPPFPFGNINPSSVSFVSEHLVKLSIEGNSI
jgi:hypothetical protein